MPVSGKSRSSSRTKQVTPTTRCTSRLTGMQGRGGSVTKPLMGSRQTSELFHLHLRLLIGGRMLKRLLFLIAFLLTCASVEAQEGIFVAPNCATRIGSPVDGKTFCFDQTLNRLRVFTASGWVNATKPPSGPWTVAEGGTG